MKGNNNFISKILFKLLLLRGHEYAMMKAVEKGNVEILKLLLQDKRVDPTDNDNYAIWIAIEN